MATCIINSPISKHIGKNHMINLEQYVGKTITAVKGDECYIYLVLDNKEVMIISDKDNMCCEKRYLTIDDDLSTLVGEKFRAITEKKVENVYSSGYDHNIMFVEIATDKDSVVFCTHVEHNGYYGSMQLHIVIDSIENVSYKLLKFG